MNEKKYRVPIYSSNEAKHIAFELQTSLRMRLSDDDMHDLLKRNEFRGLALSNIVSEYCSIKEIAEEAFNAYCEEADIAIRFFQLSVDELDVMDSAWLIARNYNFSNIWSDYDDIHIEFEDKIHTFDGGKH